MEIKGNGERIDSKKHKYKVEKYNLVFLTKIKETTRIDLPAFKGYENQMHNH